MKYGSYYTLSSISSGIGSHWAMAAQTNRFISCSPEVPHPWRDSSPGGFAPIGGGAATVPTARLSPRTLEFRGTHRQILIGILRAITVVHSRRTRQCLLEDGLREMLCHHSPPQFTPPSGSDQSARRMAQTSLLLPRDDARFPCLPGWQRQRT